MVRVLRVPKSGGIGTVKVNVVRWLVSEGGQVKRGEAIVELETEKVNYELDSPFEGTVIKILARDGDEVPVGDPLCEIDSPVDNEASDTARSAPVTSP